MSERITLELPDTLAQAAREKAERTGQTVETVLLEHLQKVYEEEFLRQHMTPGATYEVSFPIADETSAADMMNFMKSLKGHETQFMTRFPYIQMGPDQTSLTPRLPLELRLNTKSVNVVALVDTGSTVNVIPYDVGIALGAIWEEQTIPVRLAGNLSRIEARGLAVTGYLPQVTSEPFELIFAWSFSPQAPILLGQVNFFLTFNVCFYRSQGYFEVSSKTS